MSWRCARASGCRSGGCWRARRAGLEPALAPALRLGLEVPDDHAIDPRKLTAALADAARSAGVELRTGAEVARGDSIASRAASRDRPRRTASRRSPAGGDRSSRRPSKTVDRRPGDRGRRGLQLGGIPDDARVPIRPVKGQILRLHDPAGPGLLTRALRMHVGLRGPSRRRSLCARRDDRGARLRHDRHRRAGVRVAARRDRAAARILGARDRRAVGRPAAEHARQRAGARARRDRWAALGDRPLPPRHPAGPDHCRDRRRELVGEPVAGARRGTSRPIASRTSRSEHDAVGDCQRGGPRACRRAQRSRRSSSCSRRRPQGRGVAVAVGGEVVPRAAWAHDDAAPTAPRLRSWPRFREDDGMSATAARSPDRELQLAA